MSVNKAILIGRLGKDPELTYTASGRAVAKFSLATSETWKDKESGQKQEKTTWHNIVSWGRQAEVIKEYLSKGQQVYIEGRIENRSYEDKEKQKKYISEVVVQNFQFIEPRGSGARSPEQADQSDQAAGSSPSSQTASPAPAPQGAASDDDLPF